MTLTNDHAHGLALKLTACTGWADFLAPHIAQMKADAEGALRTCPLEEVERNRGKADALDELLGFVKRHEVGVRKRE